MGAPANVRNELAMPLGPVHGTFDEYVAPQHRHHGNALEFPTIPDAVVAVGMRIRERDLLFLVGIDQYDVRVAADGDRPLARIEPKIFATAVEDTSTKRLTLIRPFFTLSEKDTPSGSRSRCATQRVVDRHAGDLARERNGEIV